MSNDLADFTDLADVTERVDRTARMACRPGRSSARTVAAPMAIRGRIALRLRALLLILALAGCATQSALRESNALWSDGHYDEAVARLHQAVLQHPDDLQLRAAYLRLRDRALTQLAVAAESERLAHHYAEAEALYRRALAVEPGFERARAGLADVAAARRHDAQVAQAKQLDEQGDGAAALALLRGVLAEDPGDSAARRALQQLRARQVRADAPPPALRAALSTPITIDFRDTPLRSVFEALSKTAGINFVFDRDLHADSRITLTIHDNSVEDAIRLVLATSGLERKVLNDNTLLIYPASQAKQREYQDQVVRTFYLVNAEAKQVQSMLRTLARTRDIFIDEKLNLVAVRDTPDAVRLAEQLIAAFDVADAEVMLEVEVMEIGRSKLLDLGLNFPTQVSRETTTPFTPGSSTTSSSSGTEINLQSMNLVTTVLNPLLRLNLLSQDINTNLLANPRIRVKNREKAKVVVGEKLPVFSTTAVQGAGVASSVSYVDVGLKLEVEPQVTLDDEVTMKVNLEVNSNLGAVNSTSTQGTTTAFELGTRSAQTVLRVHDGETQVLGGLINDNFTDTFSKLPGLGDLPGVGRAFGDTNVNQDKTEIVLLITPRIVRNLALPDYDVQYVAAGTEAAIGARPLAIGPTAPRSLAMSTQGGAPASISGEPAAAAVQPVPRRGRDFPAGPLPLAAVEVAPAPPGATQVPSDTFQAPADLAPPAVAVALHLPGEVALGHDLSVSVEVSNPLGATEGEVVLGFSTAQLQAAGASGSNLSVKLAGAAGGPLLGSATLHALTAGTGTTTVTVLSGSLRLLDGSQRPIEAGASASVAIVP